MDYQSPRSANDRADNQPSRAKQINPANLFAFFRPVRNDLNDNQRHPMTGRMINFVHFVADLACNGFRSRHNTLSILPRSSPVSAQTASNCLKIYPCGRSYNVIPAPLPLIFQPAFDVMAGGRIFENAFQRAAVVLRAFAIGVRHGEFRQVVDRTAKVPALAVQVHVFVVQMIAVVETADLVEKFRSSS